MQVYLCFFLVHGVGFDVCDAFFGLVLEFVGLVLQSLAEPGDELGFQAFGVNVASFEFVPQLFNGHGLGVELGIVRGLDLIVDVVFLLFKTEVSEKWQRIIEWASRFANTRPQTPNHSTRSTFG